MQSAELTLGRRVAVVLEPGDDVISSIVEACIRHRIRQGYISTFLGAFRSVRLIASHDPIDDPEPPLPDSVDIAYTEGTGSGSIAWHAETATHQVHLHVSVGAKDQGALAYAGHLLSGTTHYIAELVIEEVLAPLLVRVPDARAHGLANLTFRTGA